MSHTVYATFVRPEEAERAAGALLTQGVRPEDISVVKQPDAGASVATTPRAVASNVPVGGNATNPVSRVYEPSDPVAATAARADAANGDSVQDEILETPEPATSTGDVPAEVVGDAKKGGLIGAGLGVVAAIAAIAIPGVGFVLGAGALASAIAGVAASAGTGAAIGAIVGYLKDQGIDDETAEDYADTVGRGGAVLALTLPSGPVSEEQGHAVLEEFKATNVNRYATRGYAA